MNTQRFGVIAYTERARRANPQNCGMCGRPVVAPRTRLRCSMCRQSVCENCWQYHHQRYHDEKAVRFLMTRPWPKRRVVRISCCDWVETSPGSNRFRMGIATRCLDEVVSLLISGTAQLPTNFPNQVLGPLFYRGPSEEARR